jgi:hypothetical protein
MYLHSCKGVKLALNIMIQNYTLELYIYFINIPSSPTFSRNSTSTLSKKLVVGYRGLNQFQVNTKSVYSYFSVEKNKNTKDKTGKNKPPMKKKSCFKGVNY